MDCSQCYRVVVRVEYVYNFALLGFARFVATERVVYWPWFLPGNIFVVCRAQHSLYARQLWSNLALRTPSEFCYWLIKYRIFRGSLENISSCHNQELSQSSSMKWTGRPPIPTERSIKPFLPEENYMDPLFFRCWYSALYRVLQSQADTGTSVSHESLPGRVQR